MNGLTLIRGWHAPTAMAASGNSPQGPVIFQYRN